MKIGDFNGDGISDIVTADYLANEVGVLLGNGDGSFALRASFAVGTFPVSIVLGDLNGDGIADIVTSDNLASTVSVLLGNGDGSFAPSIAFAVGAAPSSVGMGDFNGDGVQDLVTADRAEDTVSVLLGKALGGNDGATTFQVPALLPFSLGTQADARQALPVLKAKLGQLAEQRGMLGAFQSRIEVAANTLRAADENFQAAESRIRDADIAAESSNLARLNILR